MVPFLATAPPCAACSDVQPRVAGKEVNAMSRSQKRKLRDRRVAIRHAARHTQLLYDAVPFVSSPAVSLQEARQETPRNDSAYIVSRFDMLEAMIADIHQSVFGSKPTTSRGFHKVDPLVSALRPDAPTFYPKVAEKDNQPMQVDTVSSQCAIVEVLPNCKENEYFEVLVGENKCVGCWEVMPYCVCDASALCVSCTYQNKLAEGLVS